MLPFSCLKTERKNFCSLSCGGKDKSKVFSLGKAGHRRHDLSLTEREEEILCGKTPLPKPTGCRVQSLCECFPSGPKFGIPSTGIALPSGSSACLAQGSAQTQNSPSKPHPKQRMRSCSLWLSPSSPSLGGGWVTPSSLHSQIFTKGECSASHVLLRPCLTPHLHCFRGSPAASQAFRAVTELDACSPRRCWACLGAPLSLDEPLSSHLRGARTRAALWTHSAVRKCTVSDD